MRRLFPILLFFFAAASAAWPANPPNLELDRDSLYEGEAVTLTIRVPGAGEESTPDLSGLPDTQTTFLGQRAENRYQVVFENGRRRAEGFSGTIYQFSLQPLRTGSHPGGTIKVTADGRTHALVLPPLTILPIPPQDTVRLDLLADRETVLPDESFTVTLRVRIRRLAPPYEGIVPIHPDDPPLLSLPHLTGARIEGVEGPDIRELIQSWRQGNRQPGVHIENAPEPADPFGNFFGMGDPFGGRGRSTYLPPQRAAEVDGVPYMEFLFPATFTARDEGAYTFGPALLKGRILTGVDNARRALTRDIYAVAPAVTVRATPPPDEGRPDSFFGVFGSNLTADAQLNVSECRVGDPLKLTLSVKGPLNWRQAGAPDPGVVSNLAARFRIYGSSMQTLKTGEGRDYTFTLRPLEAGTGELPPIPISWYDTGTRAYRTVFTSPIPLKVDPSSELTAGAWSDPKTDEFFVPENETASRAPAALRLGTAEPDRLTAPWFGWLAAGPILLFLRLLAGRFRRFREERKKAARPRRALGRALRALKRIETGDPRRSAEEASAVLKEFAADWLNRESGGLTPPDWIRLLRERGAPADAAVEFGDLMTRLFEAAYAPSPKPEVESDILPRLPGLLRRIGPPASGPTSTATRLPLFLLIAVGYMIGARDVAAQNGAAGGDFEWEEAQSLAARAGDPAAFKEAAQHYASLAEQGRRDGAVFYNLGTCLLLAGEPGPALNALVRAERYWGRPADLVHNMGLARAALNGGEPAVEPWNRTLLFFHFGLPLSARLRLAVAAFGLAGLLLALFWGRIGGLVKLALLLALLTGFFFGTSVLVTHHQETRDEPLSLPQQANGQ
jgi:hypothetical protein